mmetsp:Transcript_33421/g.66274  ORF Transcript_33421/g.66274 Transcript_33421/m.66274 type:complete len:262 (-) Transcript_33421:141-926(-)
MYVTMQCFAKHRGCGVTEDAGVDEAMTLAMTFCGLIWAAMGPERGEARSNEAGRHDGALWLFFFCRTRSSSDRRMEGRNFKERPQKHRTSIAASQATPFLSLCISTPYSTWSPHMMPEGLYIFRAQGNASSWTIRSRPSSERADRQANHVEDLACMVSKEHHVDACRPFCTPVSASFLFSSLFAPSFLCTPIHLSLLSLSFLPAKPIDRSKSFIDSPYQVKRKDSFQRRNDTTCAADFPLQSESLDRRSCMFSPSASAPSH